MASSDTRMRHAKHTAGHAKAELATPTKGGVVHVPLGGVLDSVAAVNANRAALKLLPRQLDDKNGAGQASSRG